MPDPRQQLRGDAIRLPCFGHALWATPERYVAVPLYDWRALLSDEILERRRLADRRLEEENG